MFVNIVLNERGADIFGVHAQLIDFGLDCFMKSKEKFLKSMLRVYSLFIFVHVFTFFPGTMA